MVPGDGLVDNRTSRWSAQPLCRKTLIVLGRCWNPGLTYHATSGFPGSPAGSVACEEAFDLVDDAIVVTVLAMLLLAL